MRGQVERITLTKVIDEASHVLSRQCKTPPTNEVLAAGHGGHGENPDHAPGSPRRQDGLPRLRVEAPRHAVETLLFLPHKHKIPLALKKNRLEFFLSAARDKQAHSNN